MTFKDKSLEQQRREDEQRRSSPLHLTDAETGDLTVLLRVLRDRSREPGGMVIPLLCAAATDLAAVIAECDGLDDDATLLSAAADFAAVAVTSLKRILQIRRRLDPEVRAAAEELARGRCADCEDREDCAVLRGSSKPPRECN